MHILAIYHVQASLKRGGWLDGLSCIFLITVSYIWVNCHHSWYLAYWCLKLIAAFMNIYMLHYYACYFHYNSIQWNTFLSSYVLNRWDSGSNVGEFDGHSKRVLSCAFKPTRPFRIVTCGEDFLVNFYEGPPFKFKQSHRFVVV